MATVRLDTLRNDAYLAADQADQTLCPPTEVNRYVNQSIRALRRFLIENNARDRLQTKTTIAVSQAGDDTYTLPSDFAYVVNVFWDAGVGRLLRMEECPSNETEYTIPGGGWNFDYVVRYELLQGSIRFIPAPSASFTVTLKYVPQFADLAMDADTVELWDGLEEWVTKNAAMWMVGKEGDPEGRRAQLAQERDEVGRQILALWNRNRAEPRRVLDVYKPVGRWYY